jgi:hypothetical protein
MVPAMSWHPRIGTVMIAGIVVIGAAVADAQCPFEHPTKAKGFTTSLVQAYYPCTFGGNAMTETGVPSCQPPETYRENNGSSANGWSWNEVKSAGTVRVSVIGRSAPDYRVKLKLYGVVDAFGPADGEGHFFMIVRATVADPSNGTMTMIDVPVSGMFTVTQGRATHTTTINAMLTAAYGFQLPACTALEIVDLAISDETGEPFGRVGVFLPS